MRKALLILLMTTLFVSPCFAIDADDSVDALIKQKYNAVDSSLPKLPRTSPQSVQSKNFLDVPSSTTSVPTVTKPAPTITNEPPAATVTQTDAPKVPTKVNVRSAKIPWGKKINVKFNTAASDRMSKGSRVVFVSQAPLVTKNITLPTGTVIYGTVVNAHSPQMLGNGGLLSIKAEYVTYKGKTSYCEGNIVALNHKQVLFNNIKGKNGYTKAVSKITKPARTFHSKSKKVYNKVWNSPVGIIAPILMVPSVLFSVGDYAAAPFIALFHKGANVSVSKGTTAVIKFTEPVYIEY